jgi:hypothetical protein
MTLISREIQTMGVRFYLSPVRMAMLKRKKTDNKNMRGWNPCTVKVLMHNDVTTMENSAEVPQKLKVVIQLALF